MPPSHPRELFAERRRRLLTKLGERGAALFFSAPEAIRSNDSHFDYRQNSDLWYLTGFEEPESALLLLPGHEKHPVVMFVRKRDRERETWDGYRAGVEGAKAEFGADEAFLIDDLDAKLPELLEGRDRLHYTLGLYADRDAQVVRALGARAHAGQARQARAARGGRSRGPAPRDAALQARRRARGAAARVRGLGAGARAAMRATAPGRGEWEIQAEVEYVFKKSGAKSPGYTTIAGSGPNACVLHYVENRRRMEAGELLLVDAGAEVGYYTGDITRTWPVSGKFTGPQREIYDLVLRSQQEVIAMVKPGLALDRDAREGRRGADARDGRARHPRGTRREGDRGQDVPRLVHAQHRPLARHRRPRRGRVLRRRRAGARARAGDGVHGRAGPLLRARRAERARSATRASASASRTTSS